MNVDRGASATLAQRLERGVGAREGPPERFGDIVRLELGAVNGESMFAEARTYGKSSVRKATRFLSRNGIANPHRFVQDLRINADIRSALMGWAESWAERMSID